MSQNLYPKALNRLINSLSRLPGIGRRTAERLALDLYSWERQELEFFGNQLHQLHDQVKRCQVCGNFSDEDLCRICQDPTRDPGQVEDLIRRLNQLRKGGDLPELEQRAPVNLLSRPAVPQTPVAAPEPVATEPAPAPIAESAIPVAEPAIPVAESAIPETAPVAESAIPETAPIAESAIPETAPIAPEPAATAPIPETAPVAESAIPETAPVAESAIPVAEPEFQPEPVAPEPTTAPEPAPGYPMPSNLAPEPAAAPEPAPGYPMPSNLAPEPAAWNNTTYVYNNFFNWNINGYHVFDLAGVTDNITAATLTIADGSGQFNNPTLEVLSVSTPIATLLSGPQAFTTGNKAIFDALGTGTALSGDTGNIRTFELNGDGLTALNNASGLFAFAITNTKNNSYLFNSGFATLTITTATPEPEVWVLMLTAVGFCFFWQRRREALAA